MNIIKNFIFLLFISEFISAQPPAYPSVNFCAPVDIKMYLSGTFGELRSDHFHSGIDIKTNGIIGKKVYAIADGYVSRIKISVNGFGKAIYIKHPNGYTSVYCHLSEFAGKIARYVKEEQYKHQSYEIQLFPEENRFMVKKGMLIAYSGNSGTSAGPHLHFEIRNSKDESVLNPLLFGFEVKDYIAPEISGLKLYPMDQAAMVNGVRQATVFETKGKDLQHFLQNGDTITVSGNIGFGVKTHDLLNGAKNKNGVYSVKLWVDSLLIYAHTLDNFSFSETRFINSLIDYPHYIQNKSLFQRSIFDPGNKLSIYDSISNGGVVLFNDDKYHQLLYEVTDTHKNTARLHCILKSKPVDSSMQLPEQSIPENWFPCEKENIFTNENINLYFPKNSFYNSFSFTYKESETNITQYSKIYHVHNCSIPVHRDFNISLRAQNLPPQLWEKALIVNIFNDNIEAIGGDCEDGFVHAKSCVLGDFAIMVDTLKPEIVALNIHQNKKIHGYKAVTFRIKDNLSGIKSYKGTLNGKWVLMEYDKKTERLRYYIDDLMKKGENVFCLEVTDNKENRSTYSARIFY